MSAAKSVQLRRYEIEEGALDAFVAWWRAELVPAREAFGFAIEFGYADHEHSQFVWAVSLPVGPDAYAERDAAWNDSAERAAVIARMPSKPVRHTVSLAEPVAP